MMETAATKMPADVAEAHKLIGKEMFFLYTKWTYYKVLFCTADETVELLHYAAEFFFEIYREVLRDDMILTACRLTDPATTNVKGGVKSNLTVKHLMSMIPDSDTSLRQDIDVHVKGIDSKSLKFRQHRNRRISHHDLDTQKKRSTALLPGLGLNEMDELLAVIATLLNHIEQFYDQNEQSYDEGIYGSGNAENLIDFIKNEQHRRKKWFNQK